MLREKVWYKTAWTVCLCEIGCTWVHASHGQVSGMVIIQRLRVTSGSQERQSHCYRWTHLPMTVMSGWNIKNNYLKALEDGGEMTLEGKVLMGWVHAQFSSFPRRAIPRPCCVPDKLKQRPCAWGVRGWNSGLVQQPDIEGGNLSKVRTREGGPKICLNAPQILRLLNWMCGGHTLRRPGEILEQKKTTSENFFLPRTLIASPPISHRS